MLDGANGPIDGFIDLAFLTAATGLRIAGRDAGDFSGFSVSSAGDVNGDGFNDLLIGAPSAKDAAGANQEGETYVVFGGASLGVLDGANGATDGFIDLASTGCSQAQIWIHKRVSIGYTPTMRKKDAGLRIRVDRELREQFLEACRHQDKPAAQVLREFMRDYISSHDVSGKANGEAIQSTQAGTKGGIGHGTGEIQRKERQDQRERGQSRVRDAALPCS